MICSADEPVVQRVKDITGAPCASARLSTPEIQAGCNLGSLSLCSAACQARLDTRCSKNLRLLAIMHSLKCEAVPETQHVQHGVGTSYMLPATRHKYIGLISSSSCVSAALCRC